MILPADTVIRTCTGPQRVCTTEPVYVAVDELLPDDVEPSDVPPVLEPVDGAALGATAVVLGITTLDSAERLVAFVEVR